MFSDSIIYDEEYSIKLLSPELKMCLRDSCHIFAAYTV